MVNCRLGYSGPHRQAPRAGAAVLQQRPSTRGLQSATYCPWLPGRIMLLKAVDTQDCTVTTSAHVINLQWLLLRAACRQQVCVWVFFEILVSHLVTMAVDSRSQSSISFG